MKIQFTVTNQHIEASIPSKVVADTKNYLEASFFFVTDEWKDVDKTAVFSNQIGTYSVLLEKDHCMVPWECLVAGDLSVSVFGGDRVTTDTAKVRIFPSGYKLGQTPREPTPDVYAEILDRLKTIQGGTVSEADIKAAVEAYMEKNPVEVLTQADVEKIVQDYLTANPPEAPEPETIDVSQAVQEYLAANPPQVDVSQDVASYIEENKSTLFPERLTVIKGNVTNSSTFEGGSGRCYFFENAKLSGLGYAFEKEIAWVKKGLNKIDVRFLDGKRYLFRMGFDGALQSAYEAPFMEANLFGRDYEQSIQSMTLKQGEIARASNPLDSTLSVHIPSTEDSDVDFVYTFFFEAKTNEEMPLFYLGEGETNQLIPRILCGSIVAGQKYKVEYHTFDGVLRVM